MSPLCEPTPWGVKISGILFISLLNLKLQHLYFYNAHKIMRTVICHSQMSILKGIGNVG